MKTWSELTEQEKIDLEQRRLNGEFDRRRLIRFGYLSVAERRRLREEYPDLDKRFEPEANSSPLERYAGIFFVYILGFMLGAGDPESVGLIHWAIAIILYWVFAFLLLRSEDRTKGDRTELYWEWLGYRCDRHGRKL